MPGPTRVRFGVFEADFRSGELRKHGLKIKVQEKPLQILSVLLEQPGEVVTRDELRQRLWPADTFVDFDHGLNSAINKLRDALGDSAAKPRYIETLSRRGYRFVGEVSSLDGTEITTAAQGNGSVICDHALPVPGAATADINLTDADLPRISRTVVRVLFVLVQLMYLVFYIIALARLGYVEPLAADAMPFPSVAVTAAVLLLAATGIPLRLYLATAVLFDYPGTRRSFVRLFPALLLHDFLWALTPLLLRNFIGIGLAIAAAGCLFYLPFSQRTLIRMAYRAD